MDYSDPALVKAVISAIELYVKKKAQILEFHSSIENLIYNDKLEVEEEKNKDLFDMICDLGSIEALTAQVLAQSTRFLSRDLNILLMPRIYIRAFTAR